MSWHILAFWVGLHRQTQTHEALIASSKNYCSKYGPLIRMVSKVLPSIIKTVVAIFDEKALICSSTCLASSSSLMNWSWWFLCFSPELMAMLVAVSTLSPVSIQIWIPADLRDSMVTWTFDWSLSSTPVTPKNSKSVSNSCRTAWIDFSLFFSFWAAS